MMPGGLVLLAFEFPKQELVAQLCGIQFIDIAVNEGRVNRLLKMIPGSIDGALGAVDFKFQMD
jgi:hypothetical protein